MRIAWLALLLALLPAVARADGLAVSTGMIGGSNRVGSVLLSGGGALAAAGYATGRFRLQAEYEYLLLSDDREDPQKADQHRLGVTGRYAWWSVADGHIDAALEAGVGHTFLSWERTGGVQRNDFLVGLGSQITLPSSDGFGMGMNWGVRLRVSASPGGATARGLICDGDCPAGDPAGADFGLMAYFGFVWTK